MSRWQNHLSKFVILTDPTANKHWLMLTVYISFSFLARCPVFHESAETHKEESLWRWEPEAHGLCVLCAEIHRIAFRGVRGPHWCMPEVYRTIVYGLPCFYICHLLDSHSPNTKNFEAMRWKYFTSIRAFSFTCKKKTVKIHNRNFINISHSMKILILYLVVSQVYQRSQTLELLPLGISAQFMLEALLIFLVTS